MVWLREGESNVRSNPSYAILFGASPLRKAQMSWRNAPVAPHPGIIPFENVTCEGKIHPVTDSERPGWSRGVTVNLLQPRR